MPRKITVEQAIAKAARDVLGTESSGYYSLRNIRAMLETELVEALGKYGYVIVRAVDLEALRDAVVDHIDGDPTNNSLSNLRVRPQ